MPNQLETELKLRLGDPCLCNDILNSKHLHALGQVSDQRQELLISTYYDTEDHNLRKHGLAYRVRYDGTAWTATVKASGSTEGGLHQRPEWNVPVTNGTPDCSPFLTTPIGAKLTKALNHKPLLPLFTTQFTRQTVELTLPDTSVIEVALDKGEITAGERKDPILELELELKQGASHSLLRVGAVLAETFPLFPDSRSKFLRGLMLASLPFNAEDIPESINLNTDDTVSILFHKVVCHNIATVVYCQNAFITNPEDFDTLSNLRTSTLSLKALLAFFAPLFDIDDYNYFRKQISAFGELTAYLHTVNCQIAYWSVCEEHMYYPLPVKPVLPQLLQKNRLQELDKVLPAFAKGFSTAWLLKLWATVEQRKDTPYPADCLSFLKLRFAERLHIIIKSGKQNNPSPSDPVLYAACEELLPQLLTLHNFFPSPITQKLSRRLVKLLRLLEQQAALQTTPAVMEKIVRRSASRTAHRDTGLIIGWQTHKERSLPQKLDRHWKFIKKLARQWSNYYHLREL